MKQQGSSLNDMLEAGLVFDNVVLPADNYTFKQVRKKLVREDGKPFAQIDVARLLNLVDEHLISKFERNELKPDNRTYSFFLLATGNHPHYDLELKSKETDQLLIEPPSACEIREARENIEGLQQNQTSYLLGLHAKVFGRYESSSANRKNQRRPTAHTWTLFLLITNQHPYYKLIPKHEALNTKDKD